jgi:acyl-CoA reductase-like NAD-dependent aldehyde dehydrogenase
MATETQLGTQIFVNTNPATGEVVSRHAIASAAEVHVAVERARLAQKSWAATPIRERLAIISRFQQLLLARKDEVSRTITLDAGKPLVESLLTEVMVSLDAARFVIAHTTAFLRDEPIPHANLALKTKRGKLVREPLGVIGIISPWNYPFSIPTTESLAGLATGNAVVLKPSELTPDSALALQRLLHEAGVPKDVFQLVLGEGPTGAALVESPIDKLIFTGSVATGKRVAQAAASRLLPVVLELGGKDAMVVLEDADVDVASSGAVWGAFVNAGQTCLSVERCYVHRSMFDNFVRQCADKIAKLNVGNGVDPTTDMGPLISPRQFAIVESQVEDARAKGATIVCGGHGLPDLGPNFYAPTLLIGLTPDMKLMREETFGPLLPVIPFDSDDEAVSLANDSEFGLAASIWTRDRTRGEALARRIDAGAVMVNDVVTCFAISEAPHGGVKSSGIGRTHGLLGMAEMVRVKYIDADLTPGMKKLWWYGYGETFARQMNAFVDLLFGSAGPKLRGALKSCGALWRKRT